MMRIPRPKVDEPTLLEQHVAMDIADGLPATVERYVGYWGGYGDVFDEGLNRHMRQRFPRSYITGWLQQAAYRFRQWNYRRTYGRGETETAMTVALASLTLSSPVGQRVHVTRFENGIEIVVLGTERNTFVKIDTMTAQKLRDFIGYWPDSPPAS